MEREGKGLADVLNKTVLRLVELLVLVDKPKNYSFSKAAEEIGVSVSSVSRAVNRLLEINVLVVDEQPWKNTGRPRKIIKLNYGNPVVNSLADLIENYNTFLKKMEKTADIYKH